MSDLRLYRFTESLWHMSSEYLVHVLHKAWQGGFEIILTTVVLIHRTRDDQFNRIIDSFDMMHKTVRID